VINLSVTGPPDRLLNELLDVAVGRGATIVVAADPEQAQGGFPASHPGVLAVATDDATDLDHLPWLLAPGRDVPTTLPGARFGFVSGSSFAAAHVSGLVALMMQLSPGLTAAQARDALSARAVRVDGTRQAGRIDTCAVFARLTGSCTCSCTSADGVSAYAPR